jgi:hypothetical protein
MRTECGSGVLFAGRGEVVSDREGDTTDSIAGHWCEDTGEMGDGATSDWTHQ